MEWSSRSSLAISRTQLIQLAVAIANLSGILGFFIVIFVGRTRFMAFYLIAACSLLVFDYLYVQRHFTRRPQSRIDHSLLITNPRVGIAIALLTMSVFFTFGQGPIFFVFVAISLVLGILITSSNSVPPARVIGLAIILFASLVLLLSESQKGVIYSGPGDPLVHLNIIESILTTGSTEGAAEARYMPYLLFHVFISGGSLLFDLRPEVAGTIILAITFQITTLTVFLFGRRERDRIAGGIAAALLGALPPFVYTGSLVTYRSLSFVYLVIFAYLLTTRKNHRRYILLLSLISIAWVHTHHISIVLAAFLLAPLAIGAVISRNNYLLIRALGIFAVLFVYRYVVFTGALQEVLAWIFVTSPHAEGVVAAGYQITYKSGFVGLASSALPTFLHYVWYVPLLGVGAYGLYRQIVARSPVLDWRFLGPVSAVSVLVFAPNPVWIPLEGVAEISRWHLIAAPFVVIPLGIGIATAFDLNGEIGITRPSLLGLFLVLLVIVASAPMNGGIEDLAGYEKQPQRYLTAQEVAVSDHIIRYPPEGLVYGYSKIPVYLELHSPSRFENNRPKLIRVQEGNEEIRPEFGTMVFSRETFSRNAVALSHCQLVASEEICSLVIASDKTHQLEFSKSNRIYTNGGGEVLNNTR